MSFFNVTANRTINLDEVKGYDRIEGGTRVYIQLDFGTSYIDTPIPFDTFREIVNRKGNSLERNIEQLARYQAIPTP